MSLVTRRDFLVGTAAAAGTLAGRLLWGGESQAPRVRRGTDIVTLGRSGIKTTVLGVGTGTRGGSEQVALGQAGFTRLVRHALDQGLTYIDTADAYQTHLFVRLALQGVPREKYFIQTKTRAKNAEVARFDVDRLRRELRVEYIDSLLMHCMTTGNWPEDMRPVMDVLYEAKEKGHVRAIGVSCHGMEPLVASADCDWVDVHLVRINPFGAKMDGPPEQVAAQIKKMHDKGHGVLGMKIYGETGYESKQQRLEALRYVLGLGCVDAFTIGFTSTQQIDETLKLIEQATA